MTEETDPKNAESADHHEPKTRMAATGPPAGRSKPRWRRRLLIVLVVLVVLVGGLIVAAPSLVSTRAGANLVASVVSDKVPGGVSIGKLSLSWFGDCGLRNLSVSDADGREVLTVGAVDFVGGVWGAITSLQVLEKISIDSPRAVLYVADDGSISLAEAFSSPEPKPVPEEEPAPFSLPKSGVTIKNGSVQLVRADGRAYDVRDINLQADFEASGELDATLGLKLADGGALAAEVNLQKLVSEGEIDPADATGNVRIHTDGAVDIGSLADFAMQQGGTTGKLALDIAAAIDSGSVTAEIKTELTGIATTAAGSTEVKPTDLRLAGKVNASSEAVSGELNLDGSVGVAGARFAYPLAGDSEPVAVDELVSDLLAEKAIELPDFSLDAEGSIDLAAVARAVPALLKIKPGTEITGGSLDLNGVSIKGGSEPVAKAAITLAQVTATTPEGEVHAEPISINLDVGSAQDRGVEIRQAELRSGFASVVASGVPSKLKATVTGDLKKLHQQLDQFTELGFDELGGDLLGELELVRSNEDRMDLTLKLTADGVRCRKGDGLIELQHTALDHQGRFTLADGKLVKVESAKTTVDLDGQVQAVASGWYDLDQGAFHAEAGIEQADLAFLGKRAAGLGVEGLDPYSGRFALQAQVDKPTAEAAISSEGSITAREVTNNGEALASDVTVRWSGVEFSPEEERTSVQLAQIESAMANFSARDFDLRFGKQFSLKGDLEGQADLKQCMALAGQLAQMEQPPDLSGQLDLKATCRAEGGVTTIAGEAGVEDLAVAVDGETTVRDHVQLTYDAEIRPEGEKLALRKFEVTSNALAAQVTGDVEQYTTLRKLNLDGNCELHWDRITELLHALVPATAEQIAVKGDTSGRLHAAGPVNQPDASPAFHDLNASAELGWTSAEVYGVELGKLALAPALAQGQLKVPVATIPAAGGQVSLGGELDMREQEPVLRIPQKLAVMKNIEVTPELGKQLLSRFNPMFGQATRMEGKVGLDVQNIVLPLGEQLKHSGSGSGKLDLQKFKAQPGGLMALLLELGGMGGGEMYAVEVSGLDFVIKDGRISYDDFTMTFAEGKFDLKFYGSVGFDDTLDLVVSLPVHEELLKRLKVRGPVAEYARKLAGKRVDVPIAGTRLHPELVLAKVDTEKLLKDVVKEGLLGEGGLLDPKQGQGQGGRQGKEGRPG